MSWNSGDNKKIFLKLKSKLGLYHVVLTTPKTSPETHTLTAVEIRQLPTLKRLIPKKKYLT